MVIRYAYLWLDEYKAGREEGLKDRPCAIVAAVRNDDGMQRVLCLPVTHAPPQNPDDAIEIPPAVKRHLGLDDERSWIVVTEANEFVWPGPDLRPIESPENNTFSYGFLPRSVFSRVRSQFLLLLETRGAAVSRTN